MLKKLSKCEVKAAHGGEILQFATTQILREIKFWWIQPVKNVIFGTFRGIEF